MDDYTVIKFNLLYIMNANNELWRYTFNKVQEILVHSCSEPATRQKSHLFNVILRIIFKHQILLYLYIRSCINRWGY